jgi:hypothetical protein
MNQARALIICTPPKNHEPAPMHEAAVYLSGRSDATKDEQRLASEAMEWLRGKRDEPQAGSMRAAIKQMRKRSGITSQRRRQDP